MPVLHTENRMLACHLTDGELMQKGDELARTQQQVDELEQAHGNLKAAMKADMAALEARRSALALQVSRREEFRDTEVEIRPALRAGWVEEVRTDTGELIHTRAMMDSERQLPLPV